MAYSVPVLLKLSRASAGFTAFGLLSGVFYREYSRYCRFDPSLVQTQLRSLHAHAFALGTIFTLLLILLEKNFAISSGKDFKKFYGLYHSGLGITLTCMLIQGCLVTAAKERNLWVACTAGLGHSLLGVSFFYFYRVLNQAIRALPDHAK